MDKSILIVDDSPLIIEHIKKILQKGKFKIMTALNAEEGLLRLEEELPDLIISDIVMPGMDGFEFCKKVRKNNVTKLTPFIFLTVKEKMKDKLRGDDYITKPFNEKELFSRISASLNKMDELLKLSHEDSLTHVANHRSLQDNLEREINRSLRHKTVLSIGMLDIDFFKKFNDTYGHKVGDYVLFEFAQFIKKRLRGTDFFARYGGEEFCLILPDTKKKGAFTFLDRIRKELSDQEFMNPLVEKKKMRITFSAGIAEYPTDAKAKNALIDYADKALYKAKETGRNQVCFV
jgi:diguanylate cyclase (GGDEF)-like protein